MSYVYVLSGGIGILLAVLGIPLMLKKIKLNGLYGFRTKKTMGSEDIWYKSNAFTGVALLVSGVLCAGISAVFYVLFSAEMGVGFSLAMFFVALVPLDAAVIASVVYTARL